MVTVRGIVKMEILMVFTMLMVPFGQDIFPTGILFQKKKRKLYSMKERDLVLKEGKQPDRIITPTSNLYKTNSSNLNQTLVNTNIQSKLYEQRTRKQTVMMKSPLQQTSQ